MSFEKVSSHIKHQLHVIANDDNKVSQLKNLSSADRKILQQVILNTFEDNAGNLQKLKELDGKIKGLEKVPRTENFIKSISRMWDNLFNGRISSTNMKEIIQEHVHPTEHAHLDEDEDTDLDEDTPLTEYAYLNEPTRYLGIQSMQQFREKIDGARIVGYNSETDKVMIIFSDANKLDKFFNENLLGKESTQPSAPGSTTLSISPADYMEIFKKLG